MRRSIPRLCLSVVCVALFCGADWRQFRGTDCSSVAVDADVPVEWTESDSLAWSVDLEGRGASGPIVIGDRVVITSNSGYRQDRLHVLCFDTATGNKLWERQFWATGATVCHPKTCMAASTPASDGDRIFAFYSTNDLACLDLDGNLQWFRGLTYDHPNARNSIGMASSPIVVGDTVVVQVEADAESFATGIDVENGLPRWRIERPKKANWASPALWTGETPADNLVLLQSSAGLAGVRPRTGEIAWSFNEGTSTISSSAVADGIVYVPSSGITALRPIAGTSVPEMLWQENRLRPATSSPVAHANRLYTVNGAGVLNCADVKTAEVLWRLRLKGPISSTPVLAGEHLYLINEKGLAQMVKIGETGTLAGQYDLGETILCTPAVSEGALYVRSDGHLWKMAKKRKPR